MDKLAYDITPGLSTLSVPASEAKPPTHASIAAMNDSKKTRQNSALYMDYVEVSSERFRADVTDSQHHSEVIEKWRINHSGDHAASCFSRYVILPRVRS
jgi:hypothetical protein